MEYDKKLINRIWKKIDIGDENECWQWLGSISDNIGVVHYKENNKNKMIAVKKVIYETYNNVEIGKTRVKQSCNNLLCCNPNHLFIKEKIYKVKAEFTEEYIKSFWEKVNIKSDNECWEWKLSKNAGGYGRVRYKDTMTVANRIAYMIMYGELEFGMCALHSCDNPPCCNPKHLFPGTRIDNVRDMENKGRAVHVFGENIKASYLQETDVINIRNLYVIGNITIKELAKQFKISDSTIQNIVVGKTWKYASGPITKIGKGGKKINGNTVLNKNKVKEIK
jgi:hypothetical protein